MITWFRCQVRDSNHFHFVISTYSILSVFNRTSVRINILNKLNEDILNIFCFNTLETFYFTPLVNTNFSKVCEIRRVNCKAVWGLATTLFTKNVLVFKNDHDHLRNQSFRRKSAKRTLKTSARYQNRAHSVIADERECEYYTHHLAEQQVLRGWGEVF